MNELMIVVIGGTAFAGWMFGLIAGIVRLAGPRRTRVNLSRFHNGYFAQKQFFGKLK